MTKNQHKSQKEFDFECAVEDAQTFGDLFVAVTEAYRIEDVMLGNSKTFIVSFLTSYLKNQKVQIRDDDE